jgi:mannose-1-phosphate guanylyltransferase
MVLAAGEGSRLRPLTHRLAKPAVPFVGRPILTRLLDALGEAGVEEATVNLHQAPDSIRRVVDERGGRVPRVDFSDETAELLDTAGAMMPVRDRFEGSDFFLVNGDCVHELDFAALLAAHRASGHDGTLAVRGSGVAGFGSLLCDEAGVIEVFGTPTSGRPGERHFLSVMVLSPGLLEHLPDGEPRPLKTFRDWFPPAAAAGCRFGTFVTDAAWHAADTPERYLAATRAWLSDHDCGPWTADGAEVAASAELDAGCAIHAGARVGEAARLTGCVLLEGASVGAGAELRSCLLGPGARVESGASLSGQLLVAEGWV